ncbi:MAG: IS66 family transposase [Streptosporangiaceae bacterium]|nr:IS66 family transposase [Streptosporangiaceae bacterium]
MHTSAAVAGLPSLPSPEQLPDDLGLLKTMLVELLATLHQERRDKEALQHRLDLLLRRLYGPRGERFHPNQLLLFADLVTGQDPPPAPTDPDAAAEKKTKRRCRPHGRRRLPAHLPRHPKHHELPAAARLCPDCGQLRSDIGVDRSEQLDYRPATLFIIEHFVHKYVCRQCCTPPAPAGGQSLQQDQEPEPPPGRAPRGVPEAPAEEPRGAPMEPQPPPPDPSAPDPRPEALPGPAAPVPPAPAGVVVAAVKPAMPIAKGLPGPGLLAHLIVSKYVDHLPLHRLERIYERQGLFLPRSTLCDWLAACSGLLRPLYERMVGVVLASRVVHTDDTPVKMQDPSHRLSTARLWGYLGDAGHPYNVFDFTVTRQRDGPQTFLANYSGYLQADAFSGYDGLYLPLPVAGVARIIEVACNAHARRKFYEARGTDVLHAHQALGYYRQLYELERSARANQFDDDQRRRMRQELAVPILDRFRKWLEQERTEVLPKSPMGEAIGYALNNWTALVRYTEAGFLAIDNNVAEREMKQIAIGRKNWLFVGSARGGRTAAILFSFTSTCQRLGVEPWAYLQDVLTRLPTTAPAQLTDLLPDRWDAARQAKAAATPANRTPELGS